MDVFPVLHQHRHENLLFFQHRASELQGVLAIHDSSLGPAIGGVRCWNYANEKELIHDALRLAEQASLSAALFGCDAGGGKAVMWCPPHQLNESMLRALGIFIHGLGGRFIASPDLGTTSRDMESIAKETQFVMGVYRGPDPADDYNVITARGVLLGMKAAAKVAFGSAALKGRKVAIQGLGKVGSALMELLLAEGAELFVTDLFFERVKIAKDKNPSCTMVPPEEIFDLHVDILAPCAMGDIFSPTSIERLTCKIIAGAATHQLAHEDVAGLLQERGVIFVPDFLLNAGDIIMVNAEMYGIPREQCRVSIEKVYGLVENLLLKAKTKKQIPYMIAKEWALARMKNIRTLKKLYRPRLEK